MRILLIGNTGQVGWELERTLAPLGEVVAEDFPEIDLANAVAVRSIVRQVQPQVIVNTAAYTNVDNAESEPELAFAINGTARHYPGTARHYSPRSGASGRAGVAHPFSHSPFLLQVDIDPMINAYPKIAFGYPITQMEPFVKSLDMEGT